MDIEVVLAETEKHLERLKALHDYVIPALMEDAMNGMYTECSEYGMLGAAYTTSQVMMEPWPYRIELEDAWENLEPDGALPSPAYGAAQYFGLRLAEAKALFGDGFGSEPLIATAELESRRSYLEGIIAGKESLLAFQKRYK